MLDEKLLDSAVAIFGSKTYSEAVNEALAEAIKIRRIREIPSFFGMGLWEGSLEEMREDRDSSRSLRRKKKTGKAVRRK